MESIKDLRLPLSVLQNDIPYTWIDYPKCYKCMNVFHKTKDVFRFPCRLTCGHILCSSCLKTMRKNKEVWKCGLCSHKIQENDLSYSQLDYDYCLLGFIHYQKNIVPNMLQNVQSVSELPTKIASVESVCVECSMSTEFICVECSSNHYCKNCFVKVHNAGVVFKTHQLKLDALNNVGSVLKPCDTHNKKLMYYCQTCSVPICATCKMTAHKRHDTLQLINSNEKAKDKLDASLTELRDVRAMIEASKKSTVECIYKLDTFATATAQEIFSTFQSYHSILQNLERDACIELKKRTTDALKELHTVQNSIDASGNKITGIMHKLKTFVKTLPDNVNLLTIHNEVICLLEKLAIDFNFERFDANFLSFDVNSFKKNCDLKDLCQIKFEDTTFKAKMKTFYTTARVLMKSEHKSLDVSPSSFTMPMPSASRNVQATKNQPTIKKHEVIVTEILDPKTFYVQDVGFLARSDQMIKECNQCAMENKTPDIVIVGEMYLVFENKKNEWRRGIVKEIKKETTVYLVDFGRHVFVMKSQIRFISDELKEVPKAAFKFTICNVEPIGVEWSDECLELINEMALHCEATLVYSKENSGDCIVHLDYPTSIEETLLYLNYAKPRKICDEAEQKLNTEMIRDRKVVLAALNKAKSFTKQVIREEFHATVVNIISPGKLYITSVDRTDEMSALSEKMKNFYEKQNHQKIYYPHLQMACCVCVDNNWYRARIEGHHPNCQVEVFLVDIGKTMTIDWRFIRRLDDQFLSLNEGVTECSLIDIAPKRNEKVWSKDATVELKRLCKNNLKVIVCEMGPNSSAQIELYIVKKTIHYQINAYLVKHHHAEWIGDGEMILERANNSNSELANASAVSSTIMKQASQREFRQIIQILKIESPSKFYVTLVKYESAIKKMHNEIQKTMSSCPNENTLLQWNVGNLCLVKEKLPKDAKKSWYRGRIVANNDNNNFTVFLRDHGQEVCVKLSDLAVIPHLLGNVIDGAIKCHLANVKPTSSDWAKAAIDEYKYICSEECDIFAISEYGANKNDSLSVYLWGRKKPTREDPLTGYSMNWKNINELLASKGYADCEEKFKTIVECASVDVQNLHKDMTDFNQWTTQYNDYENPHQHQQSDVICDDDDDFVLEAELDPDHPNFCTKRVTAWIPAKPVSFYYFNACPTYVDNNAIIYLHEESRSNYLKQMMYTIDKVVGNGKHDASYIWKANEPCMVQYHVDNHFYRGIIMEVLPEKRYRVLFVDYGNVELCEAHELRIANILGRIPIQTKKFYLAYIKTTSPDGIWDQKILEFIHANIVNKSVYVRVEDNIDSEYVPCTLTVGTMDLIKTLVSENLAEYTSDLNVNLNLPETYDFYHENTKLVMRDVDKYKESSVPLDEFKETVAKKNEMKKKKEYFCKYDLNDTADYIVEHSDVESLQRNNTFNRQSFELEFEPNDTSTTISSAMRSINLLPFQPVKFTKDVTKFTCKIYEVLDTLHLFVEPIIQEYNTNFEILETKIKKWYNKKSTDFDVCNSNYCLAPYSEDKNYYRAVITDKVSKTHVRIRFADYLNEELVEVKSLRECPKDIMEKPLKHLVVKLHGLKPAKRVRDSDIIRQLRNLIGQTVVAFIVKNDTIPAVRLYDNNNSNVLAYKSLIDSKFFTETRD